jgi:hypothetical protein
LGAVIVMAEHEFSIGLSSDWLTPKSPIFDRLAPLTFDLDPAHPGWDNPYVAVPTRRIYTVADDGLRQPWHGTVWLNPPFGGRRGQVPWLQRFFVHADGIALVAARTSADWFHQVVVPNAQTLLFPNGKTKFVRPADGSIGKEPGTGVVLIGMGAIANAALERSGLGFFVRVRDATPYDAVDDFAKSLEEGYRVIRERVAAGGEGWTPK